MYPQRRRKKRASFEIRDVELVRGKNGYGFTISGQSPCILSCIVPGSPAELAGLHSGDYLILVNGQPVSKSPHDDVVRLIGESSGSLKLRIAETCYSDSSETELLTPKSRPKFSCRLKNRQQTNFSRAEKVVRDLQTGVLFVDHLNSNKIRKENPDILTAKTNKSLLDLVYQQRQKQRESRAPSKSVIDNISNKSKKIPKRKETTNKLLINPSVGLVKKSLQPGIYNPLIYNRFVLSSNNEFKNIPSSYNDLKNENNELITRFIVAYLGTIEMPKETKVSSSRQTVRNCIKRLQIEKKIHTLILLTILSDAVVFKDSEGRVLAHFPSERIIFCGVYSDDKNFFGLVTSHDSSSDDLSEESQEESTCNSCHVFMVDTKLTDHLAHLKYAKHFRISCTKDALGNKCKEFPECAEAVLQPLNKLYISKDSLESMLPMEEINFNLSHRLSSNSSNSDSGIGFRDEGPLGLAGGGGSLDRGRLTARAMPQRRLLSTPPPPLGMAAERRHSMPPPARRTTVPAPKEDTSRVASQTEANTEADKNWARTSSLRRNVNRKRSLRMNRDAGTVSDGELAISSSVEAANKSYLALESSTLASGYKSPLRRSSDIPSHVGKVASWATGFDKLLNDEDGLRVFTEFLEKEFSQENIMFWMACEDYRKLTEVSEMKEKAQDIFRNHLGTGALEPVNVDSQARLLAQGGLNDPKPDLFEPAQTQIFNLMKFDCYQRFLKSSLFKECLMKEMQGEPLFLPPATEKLEVKVDDKKRKSLIPWHILTKPGSSRSEMSKGSKIQNRADSRKSVKKKKSKEKECAIKITADDSSSDVTSSRSSLASGDQPRPVASREELDMEKDIWSLGCREIRVEQRCLLCIHIPSHGRVVVVRCRPKNSLREALEPLADSLGLQLDNMVAHSVNGPISFSTQMVNLDAQRIALLAKECTDAAAIDKLLMPDPLTSHHFEQVLAGKYPQPFNSQGFLELETPVHSRHSELSSSQRLPRCSSLEFTMGSRGDATLSISSLPTPPPPSLTTEREDSLEQGRRYFGSELTGEVASSLSRLSLAGLQPTPPNESILWPLSPPARRASEPPPIPPKAQTRGPPPRPPSRSTTTKQQTPPNGGDPLNISSLST